MPNPEPTHDGGEPTASGLRIGYVPGVTLTKWRRIWAERFPRVPLDVVEVPRAEQRAVLDAAAVDLCFVRLPLDRDGLHLIALYDEVPVVVAPRDHPVAAFEEVALADLADEKWVDAEASDAADRVAWGQGLAHVPLSVARTYSRKDLVHRPLTDAPTTTIALAWLSDDENPLIEEFIGIVRGRSANSSRTAAARSASGHGEADAKPAKAKASAPKPAGAARPRRTPPPRRPGPRRHGR